MCGMIVIKLGLYLNSSDAWVCNYIYEAFPVFTLYTLVDTLIWRWLSLVAHIGAVSSSQVWKIQIWVNWDSAGEKGGSGLHGACLTGLASLQAIAGAS